MQTEESRRERYLEIIRNFRLIDDDFMAVVFSDRECVQLLLDIVLDRTDLTVDQVSTQYEIKNLEGRSIRLDVYATDTQGKHYNIEIQRSDKGAVARRARYNSSLLDGKISVAGEDYGRLPETYVIFITERDVLKAGLPIYHIDRFIRENGNAFGDGAHILYVNSQIQDETALGKLMEDFYCTSASQMNYDTLARRVRHFKESEKGVARMCRSMEQFQKEMLAVGRAEGKLDAVRMMIKKQGKSEEEALLFFEIPKSEWEDYKKLLRQ